MRLTKSFRPVANGGNTSANPGLLVMRWNDEENLLREGVALPTLTLSQGRARAPPKRKGNFFEPPFPWARSAMGCGPAVAGKSRSGDVFAAALLFRCERPA